MSVMTIAEIRNSYISYFESKNHLRVPSASLLPTQDPSLLFTTAGMVPFKDYFSGAKKSPSPRLVSVQKCLRTTDLEVVGKTKRHMSFFEMLGNFSFGDYFKKEAIEFAWEFSTQFLPFPKEKIWISIFENDDEAYDIWNKHIGVPAERIVRLGRADNFWGPAGESGACGPCSELYLDRGEEFGTDIENQAPGGSGDRFMEFWNLVFNQFDFQKGQYLPLAQTGIDTGAGLERLATLVQGVDSVFDTDELVRLRQQAGKIFNAEYSGDSLIPLRVLTDHIRTLTFGMADGIFPSNESRGYVLRRVLRRAMLFGRKLGQREPLLYRLCDSVRDIYGEFYPEIRENIPFISDYIKEEEKRFLSTLDSGAARLEQLIDQQRSSKSGKTLNGKDVFQLYDTFGFPLEMTIELAEAENLTVDTQGFRAEMEKQKERGRAAWKGTLDLPLDRATKTVFLGYDNLHSSAKIQTLICGKEKVGEISAKNEGADLCFLLTDVTPFYAEGGGQLGDNGFVKAKQASARVVDCRKQGDAYVHMLSNIEGTFSVGETVELSVDKERRSSLARHHSATHLLNAALRRELGTHIKQTGSLVHPEYLRFDFSHPKAMTAHEIASVESMVEKVVASDLPVNTVELPKEEAEKRGAVMTFGEKYGDFVRVVEISDFSAEFCGGTHVAKTGDIEKFFILKESSPGAGNRRIEAVAGAAALAVLTSKIAEIETVLDEVPSDNPAARTIAESLTEVKNAIKANQSTLAVWHSAQDLLNRAVVLQQEIRKQRKKEGSAAAVAGLDELVDVVLAEKKTTGAGVTYFAHSFPNLGIAELKQLMDGLREREGQAFYFLFANSADGDVFVFGTTQAFAAKTGMRLNERLKTGQALGLTGGGKPELVQGKISGEPDAVIQHFLAGQ
jgi:alanyl-tRNA synthetase